MKLEARFTKKGEKEATLVENSSGNAPYPCGMSNVKSKVHGYTWEVQVYQKGRVEWDYIWGKVKGSKVKPMEECEKQLTCGAVKGKRLVNVQVEHEEQVQVKPNGKAKVKAKKGSQMPSQN